MNFTVSTEDPKTAARLIAALIPPPNVTVKSISFGKANGKQTKSDKARALFAAGERSLKVIMKKTGLGYHGVYAAVIRKKTKK